jgi:hypothetical protein
MLLFGIIFIDDQKKNKSYLVSESKYISVENVRLHYHHWIPQNALQVTINLFLTEH